MGKKYQPQRVTLYDLSTGEIAVLPTESQEELEKLMEELDNEHEPDTDHEHFLVGIMIRARWDAQRFRRLEAGAFNRMLEDQYGPVSADRRLLNDLAKPGNIFDKLEKRAAAAERAYNKAVRDLAQYRAAAAKAEKQNEANSAGEGPEAELAEHENEPLDDDCIQIHTEVVRSPNAVSDPPIDAADTPLDEAA